MLKNIEKYKQIIFQKESKILIDQNTFVEEKIVVIEENNNL